MRGPLIFGLATLALSCDRSADQPMPPAPDPPPAEVRVTLPAAAPEDAIRARVLDYFDKTVTTPGLSFTITKMETSEIPGWRHGILEAALGRQTQTIDFFVSDDGRYLFRGEAVDLTVDPLKALMAKITLEAQPVRGPADATVTIVEYSDFQCPFCSRAYTTLEEQVLKEYGDRVRFVFKNFPLSAIHPWAEDAALAAECAFQQGNDQFWTVYRGLFGRQSEITKDNLRDKVIEIAQGGGLDARRLRECLAGRDALEAVRADEREGRALGVTSTPTFFINGRRLAGTQTFDGFRQVIDGELAPPGRRPAHHTP